MATEKKHIAVYLAPEIEAALVAFCEQKGLKSKKGTMFSAGVNTALAEFFGIRDIEGGNIPKGHGNIPKGMVTHLKVMVTHLKVMVTHLKVMVTYLKVMVTHLQE
jgi:hypothetical protein